MKKKFSLIELLIVISVISILISLLLPALAKARDKGYTVKCLGNMRQIISAQQQYSSDFADFMIVQAAENTANVPWTSMFLRLDYLKLHTMNCPKIQNPITDAIRYSSKNSSAQYYYSYGFHNQWNLSGTAFTAANGAFLYQDSPSLLYRVNRMKRPSLTWLGTDTVNADAGEWYGYGRYTWGTNTGTGGRIALRHLSRSVAAAADGHAQALSLKQWRDPGTSCLTPQYFYTEALVPCP